MNPLDLDGPSFLGLWFLGWVLVLVVALAMHGVAARSPARDPAQVMAAMRPSELAYLIGGLERALEATIAGLHHEGTIDINGKTIVRVDRRGTTVEEDGVFRGHVGEHGSQGADDQRSLFEKHVLRRVPSSFLELEARAGGVERGLTTRLEAEGLLVANRGAASLMVAAAPVAWWLLGVTKVGVGLSRGRPVGFLLVGLAVAAWLVARYARAPRLTTLGERVVELARRRHRGLEATATSAPAQLTAADMMLAYGIYGHVVAAAALHAALPSHVAAMEAAAKARASSSSSGGCGSSGGGCGGGGGGGCGGCGGD